MFPKHLGSRTGREARRTKEAWRRKVSDGQDLKEDKWGHLERRKVLMWLQELGKALGKVGVHNTVLLLAVDKTGKIPLGEWKHM